ncbi:hypothetical protein [Paraburkholderia sp.]|uniref:hypothetical protein n=1 Tax=Paraburkholderia sp. TaxID=1926495 RepID=UPI003D6EE421
MQRASYDDEKNEAPAHSPASFMRARRPELYSDSILVEERGMDRSQFEFHLHTLTQRKEETRFEHFCRRLGEKELCPNLLPQTGPTGGGDSKVDSETYPVAESIADRWYEGDPSRAASERWAFAFSAKADWKPKVKDDVRKVAETRRGYTVVYFMTNQAVADRERAKVEDELRAKWNFDVRILDRTWIVDRVVQNGRWDVVYQTLDILAPVGREHTKIGPLDTQREQELEELDKLIENTARYIGAGWQLFEDCLQSALVARALGRPRSEVDGRFDRAQRLAEKHSSQRQLFQVHYHRAWTANWWYDDYSELNRLYELAEPIGLSSEHVWDVDKLENLWQVGIAWTRAGGIARPEEWAPRTERLREALLRHAMDSNRPTSALWARTQLLFIDLNAAVGNEDEIAATLSGLKAVLKEADGHIDYPADTVARIIEELAEVLGSSDVVDEVFEAAVALRAKRFGRGKEGEMRLRRGLQKLNSGSHYAAIRQCAAAQTLLAQEEHRDDFVRAVAATGLAYEAAGLLWAARSNLVVALGRAMSEYQKDGKIPGVALSFLRKLVWLELQLGRIPCVLGWLSWFEPLMTIVGPDETTEMEVRQEYAHVDTVLGILMLRTAFSDLPVLTWVPDSFDSKALPMSSVAMLFSLGDMERLRAELGDSGVEGMDKVMIGWLMQPAASDLPAVAQWNTGPTVSMRTVILGCVIECVAESDVSAVLTAEALLGFLEALLSTSIDQSRYAASSIEYLRLDVVVGTGRGDVVPLTHETVEDDCGEVSIRVVLSSLTAPRMAQHSRFSKALLGLLGDVLGQLCLSSMSESLRKLFDEDGSIDRALMVARSTISTCNVLGDSPKYWAKDWASEWQGNVSKVHRTNAWNEGMPAVTPISTGTDDKVSKRLEFADGPPPDDLFGVDGLTHKKMRVHSPINMHLWDRARWGGCAYAGYIGSPPKMHLCFDDIQSGEKIFRGWRKRVGRVDAEGWIGLTIITGVDRANPSHYLVSISVGEDYIASKSGPNQFFTMVSRSKEMTPKDTRNLDIFLREFRKYDGFFLAPAGMSNGNLVMPEHLADLAIIKRKLSVIEAWAVGPNHPASVSLQGVTDPVIPAGTIDVPFRRLQEVSKSRGKA